MVNKHKKFMRKGGQVN